MDDEEIVYNTEMQSSWKSDLAKRSRYYQSLLDASLLEPGAPSYHLLNDSYLIMIMTFDLFGLGKYRYTFRPKCEEAENCRLEDGTTRIFLNTKGKNPHEVSRELVEFLHYVEHTDNQTARNLESHRIKRIHDRVCRVRNSEEIGVKYMQAWEEKYYEREEARAEGLKEGLVRGRSEGLKQGRSEILKQLVQKKLAKGLQISEIADALEEDEKTIQILVNELRKA